MQPSDEDPSCEITHWGLTRGYGAEQVEVASEFSGVIIEQSSFIFYEEVTEVPIERGIQFGIRYALQNLNATDTIISRVYHPEFIKEDGTSETVSNYETDISENITAWVLDQSWELVKGDWSFQIIHEGRILCSKDFKTV